jgi:hypothetical protein
MCSPYVSIMYAHFLATSPLPTLGEKSVGDTLHPMKSLDFLGSPNFLLPRLLLILVWRPPRLCRSFF